VKYIVVFCVTGKCQIRFVADSSVTLQGAVNIYRKLLLQVKLR